MSDCKAEHEYARGGHCLGQEGHAGDHWAFGRDGGAGYKFHWPAIPSIKAADLSRNHLGMLASISRGELTITDTLRGVSHEADLITERKISEEVPGYALGRIETLLTFASAGVVQVSGNSDVTIRKVS
jgi:hypothetical protein